MILISTLSTVSFFLLFPFIILLGHCNPPTAITLNRLPLSFPRPYLLHLDSSMKLVDYFHFKFVPLSSVGSALVSFSLFVCWLASLDNGVICCSKSCGSCGWCICVMGIVFFYCHNYRYFPSTIFVDVFKYLWYCYFMIILLFLLRLLLCHCHYYFYHHIMFYHYHYQHNLHRFLLP